MEPALLDDRVRLWGLLGYWDTMDTANQPLHRRFGSHERWGFLGLCLRIISLDLFGLANSVFVRITMAIRSGELNATKKAMRSELQTLTLVAVLLATVGIGPFAAPPQELVQLVRDNDQVDTPRTLLFGDVFNYRLAYVACWTLSLVLNVSVVVLSTMLLLSLPHLTHDSPTDQKQYFCYFTAGSIVMLCLGLMFFLCGCLIAIEFLYRFTHFTDVVFFLTAVVIVLLAIAWFARVSDYICGGARQIHYMAQYYAMKHYYQAKLVMTGVDPYYEGSLGQQGRQINIIGTGCPAEEEQLAQAKIEEEQRKKKYPTEQQSVTSGLDWTIYDDYFDQGDEGLKADAARFGPREKLLAFEICKERMKGLLRGIEISERRISHIKCELVASNTRNEGESCAHFLKHGNNKPCKDVEHEVESAELKVLHKELVNEVSRILLLRRNVEIQFSALKMLQRLHGGAEIDERMWYTCRMYNFKDG